MFAKSSTYETRRSGMCLALETANVRRSVLLTGGFVMRKVLVAGLAVTLGSLVLSPTPGSATPVTVDRILYQSGVDSSVYSVKADFSLSSINGYNILKIQLTNTSGSTGVAGSTNLLTGLAFNLPPGVQIVTSE